MIPPLHIDIVIGQELIHDELCPRTTVEDVPYDMQTIDSKSLDRLTDSDDEVIRLPGIDDRVKDSAYVGRLLGVHTVLMGQFLRDVAVLRWECLTHLGASVLLTDTL